MEKSPESFRGPEKPAESEDIKENPTNFIELFNNAGLPITFLTERLKKIIAGTVRDCLYTYNLEDVNKFKDIEDDIFRRVIDYANWEKDPDWTKRGSMTPDGKSIRDIYLSLDESQRLYIWEQLIKPLLDKGRQELLEKILKKHYG